MKKSYLLLFIFFFAGFVSNAQLPDSSLVKKDSVILTPVKDSAVSPFKKIIEDNTFLNSKSKPVSLAQSVKKRTDYNNFFYLLAAIVLLFGIAKASWPRYFTNMFRVFFNSSLRQSQLTDQLVQDQLPSMLYNLFFIIVSGVFVYLLTKYFRPSDGTIDWEYLAICVAGFAIIYFVKFITLKLTGWLTGYKQEADLYTFIIFLINKIIAICLLPVIIIMSFADKSIVQVLIWVSFIIVGALLLMRFFRSYGLLQYRLKIGRFHFLLYIFSLEILPLLLLYKGVMVFFSIKL